jgi:hypothetical protein
VVNIAVNVAASLAPYQRGMAVDGGLGSEGDEHSGGLHARENGVRTGRRSSSKMAVVARRSQLTIGTHKTPISCANMSSKCIK